MKRLLAPALALAALAAVSPARADLVSLSSLPKGAPLPMPTASDRPAIVAAESRTDGIFTALPPEDHLRHMTEGSFYVRLFDNAAHAELHTQSGFGSFMDGGTPGVCFTVADAWFLQREDGDWPVNGDPHPTLHAVKKDSAAARNSSEPMVRAVRLDRLTIDPSGTASLAMTSAWVDPLSQGVRSIGAGSMSLARVAEAHGVTIFAALDPGGETVHFVVHHERPEGRAAMFIGRHMQVLRGVSGGHSACGLALVSLDAMPGGGEQARVELEALLGIEEPATTQAAETAEGILGVLGVRQEVAAAASEVRMRTMQVHLAVSRSSADAEPVTTVSFGWAGKERRQQIF